MLNICKNKPNDIKGIRHALLQFIKEQLQKAEGGEGALIKAIQVYITSSPEEHHLYDAAMFTSEPDRFKHDEVQRIADDYAIDLPADWKLETVYADEKPAEAAKVPGIDAAICIVTNRQKALQRDFKAYVKVLNGVATKPYYTIEANMGRINIGREEQVQTAEGFYRKNDIAFAGNVNNSSNRSVSRQHAHIEWNAEHGAFYLFADDGGLPPHNKIKIKSQDIETPWKLQTKEVGYKLQDGDQVILGESAVIEYSHRL